MVKKERFEIDGIIVDTVKDGFKVELESGEIMSAYIAGRLRKNKIRLTLGDKVRVEPCEYELLKGRITYRY